jgi:hypothetical protein
MIYTALSRIGNIAKRKLLVQQLNSLECIRLGVPPSRHTVAQSRVDVVRYMTARKSSCSSVVCLRCCTLWFVIVRAVRLFVRCLDKFDVTFNASGSLTIGSAIISTVTLSSRATKHQRQLDTQNNSQELPPRQAFTHVMTRSANAPWGISTHVHL